MLHCSGAQQSFKALLRGSCWPAVPGGLSTAGSGLRPALNHPSIASSSARAANESRAPRVQPLSAAHASTNHSFHRTATSPPCLYPPLNVIRFALSIKFRQRKSCWVLCLCAHLPYHEPCDVKTAQGCFLGQKGGGAVLGMHAARGGGDAGGSARRVASPLTPRKCTRTSLKT